MLDKEFEDKLYLLQQEAIANNKRIILVDKGSAKKNKSKPNSSVGRPRKGIKKKRIQGEGVYYLETKERISLTLTPTAKIALNDLAEGSNLSQSEAIERCLRLLNIFSDLKALAIEYITDKTIFNPKKPNNSSHYK